MNRKVPPRGVAARPRYNQGDGWPSWLAYQCRPSLIIIGVQVTAATLRETRAVAINLNSLKSLNLTRPVQRVTASAACVGLGVLATALEATTGPAGLLAGVMAGIGLNVLASDFHGHMTRRLGKAHEVFRNHDLTRIVGKAIALVIERAAEEPRLTDDQKALQTLAKAAPGHWETLAPLTSPPEDAEALAPFTEVDDTLAPLNEGELLRFGQRNSSR
jgi:hypothetical protein